MWLWRCREHPANHLVGALGGLFLAVAIVITFVLHATKYRPKLKCRQATGQSFPFSKAAPLGVAPDDRPFLAPSVPAYNAERPINRIGKNQLVRCVWRSAPIRDRSAMPSAIAPGFVQIDPTADRFVGSFLSTRPVSSFEPGSIELDPAFLMSTDEMKINRHFAFAFPRAGGHRARHRR